ncbi:MAG: LON peptidase substrate-binding domain-containing protein [Betaproteobacteria bacterium]|nr:LON peptidase substrate-binding domain-containing protein [Betaproteobacteria bacterium]
MNKNPATAHLDVSADNVMSPVEEASHLHKPIVTQPRRKGLKTLFNSLAEMLRQHRSPPLLSLPLFPLEAVLFPDSVMSLNMLQPQQVEMALTCLKNHTPFGVIFSTDAGLASLNPEAVGTLAHIDERSATGADVLQLRIHGGQRFRLLNQTTSPTGVVMGDVTLMAYDRHRDCPELQPCAEFLQKVMAMTGARHFGEMRFEHAAWVSFRVTELLPLGNEIKQKMLELTDAKMRLEILHRFLQTKQLIA